MGIARTLSNLESTARTGITIGSVMVYRNLDSVESLN